MNGEAILNFWQEHWGDLASILGLGISIWTLLVAKGARNAAMEARSEARRRNLGEELGDALRKSEQVGIFLMHQKWDLVSLRMQEVANACSSVLGRWDAELSEVSRDNILKARTLCTSVAKVAARGSSTELGELDLRRMVTAQLEISQLLSAEYGGSLGALERRG